MTANVSDDGGWPSLWPRRSVDNSAHAGTWYLEQRTVDLRWVGIAQQINAAVERGVIPHDWSISDVVTLPIVTKQPMPVVSVALARQCPKCDAPVGQQCITRSGAISDRVHRPRK